MKIVASCKNREVLFTYVDEPTITYQCDLMSFLEFCEEQEATVYGHSLLRKFGELTPFLFENNFKCIASDDQFKKQKNCFKKIETADGAVLRIEVKQKKRVVKFYDSKKLFNSTEDQLRQSFNVDGDDLQVVAKCIRILEEEGLDKNTIGANAWFDYIKNKFGNIHMARRVFTEIDDETDEFIRRGFRGGWCYLNPKKMNKNLSGYCLDVNSMYPWVMFNHPLPCYEPVAFEGAPDFNDKRYPLFVVEVVIDYAIIREGYVPWLTSDYQLDKIIEEDYITRSLKPVRAVLTNMELELLFKTYQFGHCRFVRGYKFKASQALFNEYVSKWYHQKMTTTGARREVAKHMLNNLFGKFSSKRSFDSQIFYISDRDGIEYKRILGKAKGSNLSYYLPVAVFVSAYARVHLINTANANIDSFIYSDTDSVHLSVNSLDEIKGMEIDSSKLGAWKVERHFTESKFLGLKCYAEKEVDGGWVFKIAGLPKTDQEKLTIDQFYNGSVVELEVSKKVPGGTELTKSSFTIGRTSVGRVSYLKKLQ